MRANEILIERILNLHDSSSKLKVASQVWDILQKSYSTVPGGFGTAATVEELISKSSMWKIVTRSGRITAVFIYRDQYGRKSIASGTDGTAQGKLDYRMLRNEDVAQNRAWCEVSGAPEKMFHRMGCKPIPAKYAHILTRKEIIAVNDDGFHYTRLIAGEPHEKIIFGAIKLTPAEIKELTAAGIRLHDLPHSLQDY